VRPTILSVGTRIMARIAAHTITPRRLVADVTVGAGRTIAPIDHVVVTADLGSTRVAATGATVLAAIDNLLLAALRCVAARRRTGRLLLLLQVVDRTVALGPKRGIELLEPIDLRVGLYTRYGVGGGNRSGIARGCQGR